MASFVDNGPLEDEDAPDDNSVYTKDGERLKALMFDNLAKLHTRTTGNKAKDEEAYRDLCKKISDSYITYHAYDWSTDPFSSSALALFGPGDFRKLYSTLVRPLADSRFHIIGEAASAHHAWIVGALDSSLRGVHLFLERFLLRDQQQLIQMAKMRYQRPGVWLKSEAEEAKRHGAKPGDRYPEEEVLRFGTTSEIDYDTAYLQVALGMLTQEEDGVKLPPDHAAE